MTVRLADLKECVGNPSKLRILLTLSRKGPMTAKQMLSEGVDIPQTTLYRMLNQM